MSNATDELRRHFNSKAVPNSKTLKEERDTVNAMIDAVEAENENLRKAAEFEHNQLEDIKRVADMMLEEHNAVLVENARLRELIADVHEALCADKAGMFYRLILASMEDDMRELGIEVD